ncbi:MAG TPA: hypothetical protein VFJ49_01630 [Methyloceanibacter sp.]|nr:hypothetical protein [Methyloceanibacter sp.]
MRGFAQLSVLPTYVALAVFLSTSMPQSAAAQDYVWSATASQSNASLLYGPPGADSGSFTLLCDNSAKKTELEIYAALGGAGDGQPLTIEISGVWAKVVIEGEAGAAQDGGDVIAKANGFAIKPLLAVLKADVAPTITVNGINTLFGDSGRTEAVAEFAKACRLD